MKTYKVELEFIVDDETQKDLEIVARQENKPLKTMLAVVLSDAILPILDNMPVEESTLKVI